MIQSKFKIIFSSLALFFTVGLHSVSANATDDKVAQLKAQIEQLQKQEEEYRATIATTDAQAKTLKNKIAQLQGQINQIQVKIQLTGKQIDQTSLQIGQVQENIVTTQKKIDYQRDTIGQLLLYLAKRDKETLVGILTKSDSLSDYFNEEQYALTVNSTLLGLVNDLKDTKVQLGGQKNDLETKKDDLETLKEQANAQKSALAGAKSETNQVLAVTKGQEAQYQKLLAQAEQQESAFFTQLQELEGQVIKGGTYIVHVTATGPLPKKGTKLFILPETSPRITQPYGCTSYARCGSKKGAYSGAPHNGVDMASGLGTPIRAIGDGVIVADGIKNPGWGNWVAIRHPNQNNLVSLYGHMSSLTFLPVGTEVKQGQVIGYEGNTGNAEGYHLHLSLYKDFFTYVNATGALYFNYFEGTINPLDYI